MRVLRFEKQIARAPCRLPIVLGLGQIVRFAHVRRLRAGEEKENQKNPGDFERGPTAAAWAGRRSIGRSSGRHPSKTTTHRRFWPESNWGPIIVGQAFLSA